MDKFPYAQQRIGIDDLPRIQHVIDTITQHQRVYDICLSSFFPCLLFGMFYDRKKNAKVDGLYVVPLPFKGYLGEENSNSLVGNLRPLNLTHQVLNKDVLGWTSDVLDTINIRAESVTDALTQYNLDPESKLQCCLLGYIDMDPSKLDNPTNEYMLYLQEFPENEQKIYNLF